MNVIFRADASVKIGSGHVMRCLTLATELRRQGHSCCFLCRPQQGHLGQLIGTKEFPVLWVEGEVGDDAAQTVLALQGYAEQVDWLVVDHYELDADWELAVAPMVKRVLVIDDLADRPHHCDLLLDQNVLGDRTESPYQSLLSGDCEQLLGPGYALLGPEYSLLSELLPERDGDVLRVLIFVGGSDPHRLTEHYIRALNSSEFRDLRLDVVIGRNHPGVEAVEQLAAGSPGISLYSGLASLAALMVRADVMLGAGGTTTWERFCLGLPALVTSVADNQLGLSQALSEQGLIRFLGKAEEVGLTLVRSAMRATLAEPEVNRQQSMRMRQLVDGKGCARVVDKLLGALV